MDTPRAAIAPYALFVAAAASMIVVGGTLQTLLPIQIGLIASSVFAVGAVAFVARRALEGEYQFIPFARPNLRAGDLLFILLTSVVLALLANVIASLLVELIPALGDKQTLYEESLKRLLRPDSAILAALAVVSITIAAPVCEEYLFRGTLLPMQLEYDSEFFAVAMNGVLFGMIHFNSMALVSLALVGAFFAHVQLRSATLWPAIIAHMALNTVNGVVLPAVAEHYASDTLEDPEWHVLAIAAALLGLLTFVLWRKTVARLRVRHSGE